MGDRRLGPLSVRADRAGPYEPGECADLFVALIRLGYLRIQLRERGYVSPADLEALLRRRPDRILPDDCLKPTSGDGRGASKPPGRRQPDLSDDRPADAAESDPT